MDTLVKKAYDNWNQVEEYDGKSLLSFKQTSRSSTSRSEPVINPMDYPTTLEHPLSLPRLPGVSSEQSLMDPGMSSGGKHFWVQNIPLLRLFIYFNFLIN